MQDIRILNSSLDRALTELERRAQGGRMVALVSHVPEVADYIGGHGHVLRVSRDETGSSVVRLAGGFGGKGSADEQAASWTGRAASVERAGATEEARRVS